MVQILFSRHGKYSCLPVTKEKAFDNITTLFQIHITKWQILSATGTIKLKGNMQL